MRTVGCGEIGFDRLGAAAELADLGDDGFGYAGGLAVMHQHLRPSFASASALARPLPRDAPVTSAVFPSRRVMTVSPIIFADLGQLAVLPPLTRMIWPVMNEAFSEPRKTIASAISSGRAPRLSGTAT